MPVKKETLTKLLNISNENFEKLEKAAENISYKHPLYRLKKRQLDYFKLLISRAERYSQFFNNPYLEQLIDTNINDLLMMNKFSKVLIELFTKDMIKTFRKIKKELYTAIYVDEDWLTSNNHKSEVDRLTEYFNKIGNAIIYLENHDFDSNKEEYYRKIFEVFTTLYQFEKQAFLYQKQFSVNSIIYN